MESTRPDPGKTVVTLTKRPLLFCFRAYLTLRRSVKHLSTRLVTRTQRGTIEPEETRKLPELATSDRDTRLSLRP